MLHPLPAQIEPYVIRKPRLEVYVPQVSSSSHPEAAAKMNRAIRDQAVKLIQMTGYEESQDTEVTGTYEIKLNERGLISLVLIVYGYTKGAAHGMTYQRGLTFQTDSGQLITLAQLFEPGVPYVAELSKHVAAQIKQRQIPTFEPFKSIDKNQDFYMTDKALVLFFGLYDLAPYVYGFQYFPISIYDLNDIKAKNGVIDALWY
ncbi:DUF3298 and DUF4163 domain-containing protein [Paenibacillus sp. OSY-SE]|uniref:DUF3298 and DUF4163 domain-containing protein n=1 Tax=Paenibacillus sp. OSY-SE TaxID=1196323 RepID=UPI0002D3886A|nr:DUF3298 and DUF4163 domain-containing protein [Paenibacillus sp. OSY-SE]